MAWWMKTPAQKAGSKAAKAWMTIIEQTGEDIETLTGLDIHQHAEDQARKWLRSFHNRHWSPNVIPHGTQYEYQHPEQAFHEEFLEYIEAFVAAFPPRTCGSLKEPQDIERGW